MASVRTKSGVKDKAGAERLRALREQMGWSPEQLGSMAGVSGKWIRHIEFTKHDPTYPVKSRLAKPFGMLPHDIWTPKTTPLTRADLDRLRDLVAA